MRSRLFSYLKFVAEVVTLRRLLDPVEVFFLPATNTFYPINSKSGCSSVKLALIQRHAAGVDLRYPEIHTVDPATLTGGEVRRMFFFSMAAYVRFSQGKRVILVTRDPYERTYSCFNAHVSGKNIMHYSHHRLRRLLGFHPYLSFQEFVTRCSRVPACFADRHYRPQSFYLSTEVRAAVSECATVDLPVFIAGRRAEAGFAESVVLNKSGHQLPAAALSFLRRHKGFNARYRQDLAMYH